MGDASIRTPDDFRAWSATGAAGLTFAGPDPHHAIGLDLLASGYRVASVDAPPALAVLARGGVPTFSLDEVLPEPGGVPRTVHALAAHPAAAAFIGAVDTPRLVVFKTNARLEALCHERGWQLLAAPAALGRRWENKVAFRALAEDLDLRQPPGMVLDLGDATYRQVSARLGASTWVVQAPHGFSGSQTRLVADADALAAARADWGERAVRVTAFVPGRPLTVNACVTARGVACSGPIVQVTGHPALTRYPLGSCGNDWSTAGRLGLDPAPFADVADRVGAALAAGGYRGVFGLDFVQAEDGTLYVIEVNPRLVASIALYAQLELAAGRLPLLARHVLAFLAPDLDAAPLDAHWAPVDGAQVILHNLEPRAGRVTGDLRAGLLADVSGLGGVAVRTEAAHVSSAGPGDMLLLAPGQGRVVGAGQELARLQGCGAMTTSYGSVQGAVLAMAAAVVDAAALAPATDGSDAAD